MPSVSASSASSVKPADTNSELKPVAHSADAAVQSSAAQISTVCFHGSSKGVLSGHHGNFIQDGEDESSARSHKQRRSICIFRDSSVCLNAPPLVSPLSGAHLFLLGHLLLWLGDDLLLLGQDHLDVARRAHVGVDAAVGAVGASPHLGGLVDLDVLDDQRVHVQALKPH